MRNFFAIEALNKLHSPSQQQSKIYEEILVVNQPLKLSFNNLALCENVIVSFKIRGEIEIYSQINQLIDTQTSIPLKQVPEIILMAKTFSDRLKDRSVQITFQDETGYQLNQVQIQLTCLRICLDVDADRDGIIEENNPYKSKWQWGINGHGAVLLVNSDRDFVHRDERDDSDDNYIQGLLDLKDFSFMIIRKVGLKDLPSGCELYLSVNEDTAKRIRIYDELDRTGYELIGPDRTKAKIRNTDRDIILAIEGLAYPDYDFDGMVEISLNLIKDGETIDLLHNYSQITYFDWHLSP